MNQTNPPMNQTNPPMNETNAPMNQTNAPMNQTNPPMNETNAPMNQTNAPMNQTNPPMTNPPINGTNLPMNGTNFTINGTNPPTINPQINVTTILPTLPKSTITPILNNPLLANISADTLKLINLYNSSLLSLEPETVANLNRNRSLLINLLDGIKWSTDCLNGMVYYKLLEDEFIKGKDTKLVSLPRILSVVPCKKDCFFDSFLNNNYTNNPSDFAKEVMKVINPAIVSQCQNTIGKLLPPANFTKGNITFDDIFKATSNGSIPLDALMTKSEIGNIKPSDVTKIVSTFGSTLDDSTATILAAKIDASANFTNVAVLGAKLRADILANAPKAELLNNLDKFAAKCDDKQALVITKNIVDNGDRSDILKLLGSTGSTFANKIPLDVLLNKSISFDDLKNVTVPDTFLQYKIKNELSGNKTLTDLDPSTQIILAPKINAQQIAKIEPAKLINLLGSISSSTVILKSNQRTAFLETFFKDYAQLSDTDAANKFDSLDTQTINSIAEIIVNANSSVYNWLRTTNNFVKVIEKNSQMSSTKCCSFLYQSRALYASEAIKKLVPNKANIKATDLDSLGTCFAALIPSDYLDSLSTANFKSQLSYFNLNSFQPNSSVIPSIKTKLEAIYNSLTSDTDRTTFISDVGSIIVYMDGSIISDTIRKTSLSSVLTNIKNSRDLTSSDVQKCRIGSDDDSTATTKNQETKKSFVSAVFSVTNKKKRQAATTLTCDLVNTIISAIDTVQPAQFTAMSMSEFTSCIQVLGQNSNQMSSDQYAALAAKVPITSLTDSDILTYNKILTGYSSTDLAKLTVTSVGSIQALGKIQSFTAAQQTSLVSAIKGNGSITATQFSYMGNLACGLSQTDLNSISDADFKSNIKSLSVIDAKACPSISLLYTKYKSAAAVTSPDSVTITEIDSLAAGISTSEAAALDLASVQALSTNALYLMPAATVNSFSAAQIKTLSGDQLSSVLSNPNSGSFSSTITSILNNASKGVYDSKTDTSSISTATVKSSSFTIRYDMKNLLVVTIMSIFIF